MTKPYSARDAADSTQKIHLCKDCAALPEEERPVAPRPAFPPGPRCATHHRVFKKEKKERAKDNKAFNTYGAEHGEYERVLAFQGGTCAMPRCTANGSRKRLAWDHDHSCCPGETSCGICLRGLLCGPHNYELIGKYRNSLQDALDYLADPPIPRMRGQVCHICKGGPRVGVMDDQYPVCAECAPQAELVGYQVVIDE